MAALTTINISTTFYPHEVALTRRDRIRITDVTPLTEVNSVRIIMASLQPLKAALQKMPESSVQFSPLTEWVVGGWGCGWGA